MNKWTQKEKDKFLSHVEQHQCDTFEEEVEAAWESLYAEPEVEATSNKKAQQKWRKEYTDIRSMYDNSYVLMIKRIASI